MIGGTQYHKSEAKILKAFLEKYNMIFNINACINKLQKITVKHTSTKLNVLRIIYMIFYQLYSFSVIFNMGF